MLRMMGWYAPAKVDVRENVKVHFTIGVGYQDAPEDGNGIVEMQLGEPL